MQNISTNTLCVGYLLRIYISTNIPQYSFITQMYGSEHTARRRGRFIAPVFQPNQMVLMWRNDANCNAILWNFVGTSTMNRPLRLRGGRGKTWDIINKNNEMGNANVWQRTFRNIHLLRKCMAANTPQGVGADSSRPFFNPNQMVLMCRNDANCNTNNANCNAILCNYVGTV